MDQQHLDAIARQVQELENARKVFDTINKEHFNYVNCGKPTFMNNGLLNIDYANLCIKLQNAKNTMDDSWNKYYKISTNS
jgi:hypothetical protein